jgi:tRNA(fMet)-specific endonuclease VapC
VTFLLDANTFIYLASGDFPHLTQRVDELLEHVRTSAIVLAEVALGSENGLSPPPDVLADLLLLMPVVPFDQAAADAYARLPFKRGRFDRLLAAHALSLNAVVVTANEQDFADIPGLRLENWTKPQ